MLDRNVRKFGFALLASTALTASPALAQDPARVAAMGQAARAVIERDFGRADAFARWDRLFSGLTHRSALESGDDRQ